MTSTSATLVLRQVKARDVWPNEARDFTWWLLANVDVHNSLFGMEMVLDVAEHPVGGLSMAICFCPPGFRRRRAGNL